MLKKHVKRNGLLRGTLWGLLAALLITVGLGAVIAVLILNSSISEHTAKYYTCAAQFVSCFVGFLIAGKLAEERVALRIGCCVLLYVLIIMGVGLVLFDGALQFRWGSVIAIVLGYVFACTFCIRKVKFKRNRKSTSW